MPNISNEWRYDPDYRLPYEADSGAWIHRDNPDAVTLDDGKHYFLLSERPRYYRHGTVYATESTPVPPALPKGVDERIL